MVVRFGMDSKVGQVAYEPELAPLLGMPAGADWRPRHYGEATAAAIDEAVRKLIDAAFGRAVAILNANRALLKSAASDLLAKETMSEDDLHSLAAKIAPAEAAHAHPVLAAASDRPVAA